MSNTKELPDIIQEKVDSLGKTTLCSSTDIRLAAKKLIILANNEGGMTDERIAVWLEQIVEIATTSSQTAYRVASDMENLAAVNTLKPFTLLTWSVRKKLYVSRIKYNIKTMFGLIPWIDYKTRNWWKL